MSWYKILRTDRRDSKSRSSKSSTANMAKPRQISKPRLSTSKSLYTAAAKSLQACLTLCDPTDGSPPGSPVPGILQARTLERVAISFSNAWKWKVKVKSFSRIRLVATPWTAAYQAPPSMGFSRQEYWSGVPLPSPPCSANNRETGCWLYCSLSMLLKLFNIKIFFK